MKTLKMPRERFDKLAEEWELRCPNATYILLNANGLEKGELLAIRHRKNEKSADILTVKKFY